MLAQFGRDAVTASPEAYRTTCERGISCAGDATKRWRKRRGCCARRLRWTTPFAQAYSALAYVYPLDRTPPPAKVTSWIWPYSLRARRSRWIPARRAHAVLATITRWRTPIEAELTFARRGARSAGPGDAPSLCHPSLFMGRLGSARYGTTQCRERQHQPPADDVARHADHVLGDREEARGLWAQADELGAARPLCSAISRLGMGQTQPLADWYRTSYKEVPATEIARLKPLLAGVVDTARRPEAREWLRGFEGQFNPASS